MRPRIRRPVVWLVLWLALATAVPAAADYLRVSRAATLKEAPARDAEVVRRVERGTLLRLAATRQRAGYYQVRIDAADGRAWIYRTLVRRFPGDPPPGSEVLDAPEVDFPDPAPGPVPPHDMPLDVSAFRDPDCPPEGNAVLPRVQAVNRLKNRTLGPRPSQVRRITMDDLRFPGDDQNRWSSDDAIEIDARVVEVKAGSAETCNCGATAVADKDTHIELALEADAPKPRRIVVEVTPAWRAYMASQGVDWSTRGLRDRLLDRWVRVRGWLMFDTEHDDEAENTAPGRSGNWRATAWEIHPITGIEPLPAPIP